MDDPSFTPEINRLGRAIRFAFVSILLGLSYLNLRASLSIPAFQEIFRDMLNGKPLPALTAFIISASFVLNILSLIIPVIAIGVLFTRRLVVSFYLLGVLALLIMAELLLLYYGLSGPLYQIIATMQGGQ